MKSIIKKIGVGIASLALIMSAAVCTAPVVYASGGSAVEKAEEGLEGVNPGATDDLMGIVNSILNTVFVVVGIVAVVMIILGGINYSTSQGDPGKATKAKNTIMYAIIGLVVVIISFAVVNFVLAALA